MIEYNFVVLSDDKAQIGEDTHGKYCTGCNGTLPSLVIIPSYANVNGISYKIVKIAQHAFIGQNILETIYITFYANLQPGVSLLLDVRL